MLKLYIASQNINVMFVCDDSTKNLQTEARHFLHEEERNGVPGRLVIKEVVDLKDIPEDWVNCFLWGFDDDEVTPANFLAQKDAEYAEYMRLKAKFER